MMKSAPYTIFGKTKEVPLKVFQNNTLIDSDTWDEELWIEREESWYALLNKDLRKKRVRVIERKIWLYCKEIN